MARRKNADAAAGGIAILALVAFALLFAFGLLGPVAILVWWLYAEWKAAAVRHIGSVSEVGPTQQEISQLARQRSILASNETKFVRVQADGNAEGLYRRADGRFDERSRRGRDLNAQLELATQEINNARAIMLGLEAEIGHRLDDWASRVASKVAARLGVLTWMIMMAVFWFVRPAWISSVGSFATVHPDSRILFGASIAATGVALSLILILRSQYKRSLVSDGLKTSAVQLRTP